jgi:hypothetical protein
VVAAVFPATEAAPIGPVDNTYYGDMIKEAIQGALPDANVNIKVENEMIFGFPENVRTIVLAGLPDIAWITKPDGAPLRPGELIGTGTVIEFNDGKTLTAVVFGDVDGTGAVELADVNKVLSHFRGRVPLAGPYLAAADINNDGNVSLAVVNRILSYFRGRVTTLADR